MRRKLVLLFVLVPFFVFAQANRNSGGQFSLGVRSTVSMFNDSGTGMGTGFGGQFRLRFFEFLNSEWYADYLTSGIGQIGTRTDYHVGWSVMFYLGKPKRGVYKAYVPKPYFLTGHCFDYTRVNGNNPFYLSNSSASRWSSAVQAGFGMHIPLSPRFDFSTSAQYMMHFGKEILTEERTAANGDKFLYTNLEDDAGIEGHLLITFSLNYRLADFWKDSQKGGAAKAPIIEEGQQ